MANKRKDHASLATNTYAPKRQRQSGPPHNNGPRLDPTYGQRGAFPGLDDSDDEPSDELSAEAIAYLRSVR